MSREHKYRTWDEDNKEWCTDFCIELSTGNLLCDHGFTLYCQKIILEQWTGLLDKEGVEIYEGDIVRLCYGIPPTFDTLIIEYAADEVVADISVSGWWMRNIRPNGVSGSLCKTYENDLEVIGNIHQHPQLLE